MGHIAKALGTTLSAGKTPILDPCLLITRPHSNPHLTHDIRTPTFDPNFTYQLEVKLVVWRNEFTLICRGLKPLEARSYSQARGMRSCFDLPPNPPKMWQRPSNFYPDSNQRFVCWWGRLNKGGFPVGLTRDRGFSASMAASIEQRRGSG